MNVPSDSSAVQGAFPRTRWSIVLAATRQDVKGGTGAMEALCRAYWYPIYAFVRRSGQSPHDAQDLTQGFFGELLKKRWLDAADPGQGRLRSFLVGTLKHYMAKEWRRANAQRRGGGSMHLLLDTAVAESRFVRAAETLPADQAYDRQWALTLLELSVNRLRDEFRAMGNPEDFEVLKGTLLAPHGGIDYGAVAGRLQLSPGAARVAVHRLRRRFRTVFREEVSLTLADGADLDSEMRHLAAALAAETTNESA